MGKNSPRPLKRFGQNFLQDASAVFEAVQAADISEDDRVLEVGPGKGILTNELQRTGAEVTAVEIDNRLFAALKVQFALQENLTLLNADILQVNWKSLFNGKAPWKILANLPYNISSPFILKLIEHRELYSVAVILLQKEFAARLVARPESGKSGYSSLSVLGNTFFRIELLRNIPPEAFDPAPKVESTLILLTPRQTDIHDVKAFLAFVKASFLHRRKKLDKHLRKYCEGMVEDDVRRICERYGSFRPDEIAPETYVSMFESIHSKTQSTANFP